MKAGRPKLVLWHRWFGLIGAIWLFLLGLTGSILVFQAELDRALNPDLFWAPPPTGSAEPLPVARLVAAAEAAMRAEEAPTFLDLPKRADEAVIVYFAPAPDADPHHSPQAFVHPYTGEVLGTRVWGAPQVDRAHLIPFVYQLHMTLHGGTVTHWLLGLLALLWIVDHAVSAALAFPVARRWAESLRIRPSGASHKLTFDLHRAVGLWLFPVTFVLAVSGVYFNWYPQVRAAVDAVSPLTPRPDELVAPLPSPLTRPTVDVDRALATARQTAGGAQADGIAYNAAKGVWWVRLYDERDIDSHGRWWVFIDARSGAVLSDRHATEGSAGDVFMVWQYPLHSGKAFGWPGRLLIFAAGLATCGFVVTGLMLWARKARARTDARRRTKRPVLFPAE